MFSACWRLTPNCFAAAAFSINALDDLPRVKTVAALVLATASTNSFSFKAKPLLILKALAWPNNSAVLSCNDLPVPWEIMLRLVMASALNPACSVNLVKSVSNSPLIWELVPKALLNANCDWTKPSVLTWASPERLAISVISETILLASL